MSKQLDKKLSLYGLTMIAIGSVIGAGIFGTPTEVLEVLPHQGWTLAVWALGGLVALCGALTFAELGGLFPKSGGVYVYLRNAYGDLVGFLYGWVILLVVNTGALAALSLIFARYVSQLIPGLTESMHLPIGIFIIVVLTAINAIGINTTQRLASLFTSLKLIALLGIIIMAWVYYAPATVDLNLSLGTNKPDNLISAIFLALIGVQFSFGGWHHASYLSGETINAQRTVPRAMIIGTIIVTIFYMLINLAYMQLLPMEEMLATKAIASDALGNFSNGKMIAAIIVSISVCGTIGIYTVSAPRIYFAMAADGLFFKQLAYVHPKWKTPVVAMFVQAALAIILLLFFKTFSNLISYVTFIDVIFMTLAGISIFIFRKKMPDAERPYRTVLYPIVPLLFILISSAFIVNTLIEKPVQALAGLGLVVVGVLIYFYFKGQKV